MRKLNLGSRGLGFDVVTNDIERLSGRSPKPLRDVLASSLA